MHRWLLPWLCLTLLGACRAEEPMPTRDVLIGGQVLHVEVAATPAEMARGLMHRTSLASDRGMLFVFPEAGRHCMWMKNTLIPLSVTFIDAAGLIINTADMAPETLDTHCATMDARSALEVEQGWFGKHGVTPGQILVGLPAP